MRQFIVDCVVDREVTILMLFELAATCQIIIIKKEKQLTW